MFCERIFGPVRDWECNCGKFKFIKYKGVVCDRCGVEVTESKVRRERMGHIELAVPVAHVWFLRKSPSRMGTLLGMKLSDIEKVVYYARHAVLEDFKDADGKVKYKARQLLTDEEVHKAKEETKGKVAVGIGAGAIRQLLEEIDVKKTPSRCARNSKSPARKPKRPAWSNACASWTVLSVPAPARKTWF